ncbi:MAG: STAS domain-containing protein [Microthrixaceae bacterium]
MDVTSGDSAGAWLRIDGGDPEWVVRGEIDYHTSGVLGRGLRYAAMRPGPIVLDMSGVSFTDSSAVRELLRLRQAGYDVVINRPSKSVQRILDLTNLGHVFIPQTSVQHSLVRSANT